MRNDAFRQRGANECFSKAGLAEGTSAATIQIAAPNGAGIDFAIDGVAGHKADTDNIALTAAAQQAALTTCLYLIMINAAGTVSSKRGEAQLNADLDAGKVALQWPECDADKAPIGGIKIRCNNAATFTAGTTDLSATDVVETIYDFAGGLPSNPQIT